MESSYNYWSDKNKEFAMKFASEKYKTEVTVDRLSYIKYENKKHHYLKEKNIVRRNFNVRKG